jgi:sigma-B regulation protein RsbU (phosphoserine phosphatase)
MAKRKKNLINLESLLRLSAQFNETHDINIILNSALLSLMGKLRIFNSCILIPRDDSKYYNVALCKGKASLENIPFFSVNKIRKFNPGNSQEAILLDCGFHLAVPVNYHRKLLALICLGKRAETSEYNQEELYYIELVSLITASALQSANDHQAVLKAKNNLESRNQLLTTLFEMSRDFSILLSRTQIIKMLSFHLMGQLMVNRFAVFIENKENIELIVNRFDITPATYEIKPLFELDKMAFTEDIPLPGKAGSFLANVQVKVISPMVVHGSTKGLLLIGKKMNNDNFSDENIQFIEALGNTAISALENERLFQEEIEKIRLEGELSLALEIQKNLLPSKTPEIKGFQLSGISIPSHHVGGDYYDFIWLSPNEILIAIADVSGKGMPAAILMANVQAALRVLVPPALPLSELVLKINNIVFQNTSPDKFVTFFCGILNTDAKTFKYLNAGHNPPLYYLKDGNIASLTEGGLILGVLEKPPPYSLGQITLNPDEFIVFYTDGITEAINKSGEEFGEQRLRNVIENSKSSTAFDVINNIIQSVKYHSEDIPQPDDITLIVLKST